MLRIRQFVGNQNIQFIIMAMLTLAGCLVAYHTYFLGQRNKELQAVILANTSLVAVEKSVSHDIKILYKEHPIANLSLIYIVLENTGNVPILVQDYAKPIKIVFPPQAEIIEAAITDSDPSNIGISIQNNQNSATLSPALLNPKDRAFIRFLVANMPLQEDKEPFQISTRIVGVNTIAVLSALNQPTQLNTPDWSLLLGVLFFGSYASIFATLLLSRGRILIMQIVLAFISLALWVLYTLFLK